MKKFIAICLLLSVLSVSAFAQKEKRMYAVYKEAAKTLTFYYDEKADGFDEGFNRIDGGSVYVYRNESQDFGLVSMPGSYSEKVVFNPSFADARPTSTAKWFYMCRMKSIEGLEYLNTSKVKDMSEMFYDCFNLTSLDLSHFYTGHVSSMCLMFYQCTRLESLDLSGFDTHFVKDMHKMFSYCESLKSLDLSNFNTDKVENMACMFQYCKKLESLNISGFNTESVTNMNGMFYGCVKLSSLDVSRFNTESVTDMHGMFCGCKSLTSLDVSRFKTSNVTDMGAMFSECMRVPYLDVSHFDTRNVTIMNSMFNDCFGLTSLNLSSFNTGKVTKFSYMFYGCKGLTSLDLSSFDVNDTPETGGMFGDCSSLNTIYVGRNGRWVSKKGSYNDDMFHRCWQLKGGNGTVFKEFVDHEDMACVDGGPSSPGYFTAAPGYPTSIILDNTSLTFYGENALAKMLTATVGPNNTAYKDVIWTSDNTDVAVVNRGMVHPGNYGTATITAETINGIRATCTVTVKEAEKVSPWSVSFPQTDYYLSPGKTCDLGLIIVEKYATDFTVTSTMPQVAEVSADGKSITAKEIGNCRLIIQWTDPDGNSKTAMARVEVR